VKKYLIKTGAYLTLIIGILIFLVLLFSGVLLFLSYPEANGAKKAMLSAGIFSIGLVVLLVSIAFYEAIFELLKAEKEIENILEHEKETRYFTEHND
jgi:membrane protease YdiL (CAAX protease family)